MPKRKDIESILIIGAGPIIIGQACEFDYSGTQATRALKEEGYRVILINSNPATIMTDPETAEIGNIQERTGTPSTCTVQAPHCAMPQPYLVPVNFSLSRSTHNRGISGFASTIFFSAFTVISYLAIFSSIPRFKITPESLVTNNVAFWKSISLTLVLLPS